MENVNITTLLQLGPLAAVLLYIVIRLERTMGAMAVGLAQTNRILLLLLRHAGVDDQAALSLCEDAGPAGPRGEARG